MINYLNLKTFDAAVYLETKEDVLVFLNKAFFSRDTGHIISAVESVLRSKPVRTIQESGSALNNVEQTFGEDRKPTLQKLICIDEALNSQLRFFQLTALMQSDRQKTA